MSRKHHDYTKHSKAQDTPVETEVAEEVVEQEVVEEQSQYILGVVTECVKLNVRTEPDPKADIITTLPIGTEVQVDIFGSANNDFYKVITGAGIEGYCMTNFINIE